jgi:hypothetical protein
MISHEEVTSRQFQFRLTFEEWMATEFERVTIQYEGLLDLIDQVRFFGINGLIQKENKKISPFSFLFVKENNEEYLVIIFSIPIFQSLDSFALQTGMEYFSAILKYVFREKKSMIEAEIEAFNDIKKLHPIRQKNKEIIPYEDYSEKIEIQTRLKVRMGLQMIPMSSIEEKLRKERIQHLNELRLAKKSLANIQSNLKEYSQQIAKRYRIKVESFLFQTSLDNRFEPNFTPIFILNSSTQHHELFSVLVITEAVINRINPRELEILLAYEIIFDLLKGKFSRGTIEKEIFLILSEDGKQNPQYLIEKEISKFFSLEEVKETRKKVQSVIMKLLDDKYPILRLD